jgi:hypothetical protein
LTRRTLPGIVLYKLYTYFFHVFCMYSIHLSTDIIYSCIPGGQGGPFFFRHDFFWRLFYVQIGVLQFVSRVQFYAKLIGTNLYVTYVYISLLQIDVIKFVLYKLCYINLY